MPRLPHTPRVALAVLSGVSLLSTAGLSAAPPSAPVAKPALSGATPEQAKFFESRIRPLLSEKCQSCHGASQGLGGLRLHSRALLLRGGGRGAAIVIGQPEQSRLIQAVQQSGSLKMPPDGRLTPMQIAELTDWVRQGAPWPDALSPEPKGQSAGARAADARRSHWAFQRVRVPVVPRVKQQGWVKNPVDAFVLARLEARGLKPAPAADRRTLIRRVTYDLTGLPPLPRDVDSFVQDRAPDAWEKVVDRLLATPEYGEKWGRHWLDVARYADSNGLDENTALATAWRYRDWVVRALNHDLPYDQFVTLQLAGDLLPPSSHAEEQYDRITATGFLVMGPKVLAEPDKQKMVMDIVDEQIDVTSKAFLGLTVSCARCHDHKFDPVSQRDYYGLAGIFKSTRTMETVTTVARVLERPLAPPERVAERQGWEKKLQALKDEAKKAKDAAEKERLNKEAKALEASPPDVPMTLAVDEGKEVGNCRIHLRGSHLTLGDEAPRQFPVVLAGEHQTPVPAATSGRLELARWLTRPEHPLTGRVMVNRVWRWHFGRGLVGSTDNFGILGDRPSHLELLDWLAASFTGAANASPDRTDVPAPARPGGGATPNLDWSVKRLHRLLLTSSTYRMSSRFDALAAQKDPENLLLWRAPIRRLEAEEVRDGLLAVSGLLDPARGGSLLTMKNGEYFFDHTSKDKTRYETRRRSLYLPIVRNHLYEAFQLFDFGDASVTNGNRAATTGAPQALFLLNSDVAQDAAVALAAALPISADPTTVLNDAYVRLFARTATPREVARDRELLARFTAAQPPTVQSPAREKTAWTWLCHTLLSANEFLFLR